MENQAWGPENGQGGVEFVVSFSSPEKGSSVCQEANSGRTRAPLGYSESSTLTPPHQPPPQFLSSSSTFAKA